jgi:hypothetical protein
MEDFSVPPRGENPEDIELLGVEEGVIQSHVRK